MEWISVKNRLPSDYTDVIVFSRGGILIVGYYNGLFDHEYKGDVEVTQWMPLPPKPIETTNK